MYAALYVGLATTTRSASPDLHDQLGDRGVGPVEDRRAEGGEVDHQVRVGAGELADDVRRGAQRAALRLGVPDDHGGGRARLVADIRFLPD